jgi:hypothetical protein
MATKKTKNSPLYTRTTGAMKTQGIFTLAELAKRLSSRLGRAISGPALCKHLNGRATSVRAELILAISDELDCSAHWLHRGEGDPQKKTALSETHRELHCVFGELTTAAKDELVSYAYKLLRINGKPSVVAPYPPAPRTARPG